MNLIAVLAYFAVAGADKGVGADGIERRHPAARGGLVLAFRWGSRAVHTDGSGDPLLSGRSKALARKGFCGIILPGRVLGFN